MHTRLRRSEAALAALLAAGLLAAGGAAGATEEPSGAEGWQGLLGSRPLPELGGRWIVVLRAPSLADRVREVGGRASELQMRVWTTAARDAQDRAIAKLAFRGVPVQPEQSYVRVLNGFAASLDPRLLPALERDPAVQGVFPVRAAYPGRGPRERLDPRDGRVRHGERSSARDRAAGVRRLRHHGRAARHRRRHAPPVPAGETAAGARHGRPRERRVRRAEPDSAGPPGAPRDRAGGPRRRASAGRRGSTAWLRARPSCRSGSPAGSRTRTAAYPCTGARTRCSRASRRPSTRTATATPTMRCGSRSSGSSSRSPPSRTRRSQTASDGALALDTLVVAPAGNDGAAGPGFGSVAAPGGAPGALGVAAADSRRRSPTVHLLLRSGLRVLRVR